MIHRAFLFGSLLVLILLPRSSFAGQVTTATVTGRVVDTQGAVLPGVTVTARQTETGLQRSSTSDAQGRYILAALPPGSYEVRAELSGFRPLVRSGITLTIAQTAAVDLTMSVGGVAEQVTVVGDASAVNTRTGELSYLVDARTIEELPLNGRNYTDLALLQPSVVAYPHRDGGSVVAHGLGMSVNGQDPRFERVFARRDAAQRHDQRAGWQCRRYGTRDGNGPGISRRDQRLQRGVRAHERRSDQRPDQIRQQQRGR